VAPLRIENNRIIVDAPFDYAQAVDLPSQPAKHTTYGQIHLNASKLHIFTPQDYEEPGPWAPGLLILTWGNPGH
jgi:hypothetical protein